MEKEEILNWSEKHDKDYSEDIQKEKQIGDRLRQTKELTKPDLIEIIKWKFEGDARRTKRELNLVADIDERDLKRVSNLVFNLYVHQDLERIGLLCSLNHGIGPAVTSTILTFYDPDNYGVFDFHVWNEVFGDEKIQYTAKNYIRLLSKLREIATRYDLQTRTVEKAFFKKNIDEANSRTKKN